MRLLQMAALAAFALLSLKIIGLAASGAFDDLAITAAQAQDASEQTPASNNKEQETEKQPVAEAPVREEGVATENKPAELNAVEGVTKDSRGQLTALLGNRREQIEKRERDLKLREDLLKAAEKRVKAKLAELKKLEKEQNDPEKQTAKKGARDLVVIYESMKPKDAAKIFDALALDVLYRIATAMNPRKMSAVLAEMEVKAAERLTVEMAARSLALQQKKRKLPKIGG